MFLQVELIGTVAVSVLLSSAAYIGSINPRYTLKLKLQSGHWDTSSSNVFGANKSGGFTSLEADS